MSKQTPNLEIADETKMARVFVRDLPRLDTLQRKCQKRFGGKYARQHCISKALDSLERELGRSA